MPYTPVPVERFGGLKLDTDPGESAQYAIAGQDFDLTTIGQVKARGGYELVKDFTSPVVTFITGRDGDLIGRCADGKLRALKADGTLATSSTLAELPRSLVLFANPAGSLVVSPVGTTTSTIHVWAGEGTGFLDYPSGKSGQYVASQSTENRLVIARCYGEDNGEDRVRFAAPGELTFADNDYVLLAPGSGPILGMVSWRNSVFVFKHDRFFEFYGNSTDAVGNAVFNYRTTETKIGALPDADQMPVCAAPDGVYFWASDGVYRTTGGPPVRVSRDLDPLFTSGSLWAAGGGLQGSLEYHQGRVYVGTAVGTYVYWMEADAWLPWSHTATGYATGNDNELLFTSVLDSASSVYRYVPTLTTDAGAAITASYQSGWGDFGYPQEKTIRETILWGTGTPTVQLARDYNAFDAGDVVGLGTSAAREGRRRTAIRGTEFSYKLTGTAPWSVSRLVHNVRGVRSAGVETAA